MDETVRQDAHRDWAAFAAEAEELLEGHGLELFQRDETMPPAGDRDTDRRSSSGVTTED